MRDTSLGIYCLSNKTFYYLETGSVYVANTIDRIKKALVKRGLVEFTDKSFLDTTRYKVLTCSDASLEGYEMQPIYISQHVKKIVQAEANNPKKKKKSSWG